MKHLLLSLTFFLCCPALAGELQLTAGDGIKVSATEVGKGVRGVVLVHADGTSAEAWKETSAALSQAGFRVLSIDLRGHGRTGGAVSEEGYPFMLEDVKAAVTHLQSTGAQEVTLVGVELGGVLAFQAAGADLGVSNVIMISPRLSVKGVKVTTALASYGERPLLLVAGSKDVSGVRAAEAIRGKVPQARLEVIDQGDTGMRLFQQSPRLEGELISWISSVGNPLAKGQPSKALTAGDLSGIETSGTKMGDPK